ncbi:MAG TPA: hypothetical protein VHM19_07550 [Polyangiales bacterium]|nr:hypothetical protein [Polyangiales bacterium]
MLLIAIPGAQEVIEDAVHFIADGHTAHEAEHAGEQPGHCCSGLFHVCACHAHAVGALASPSVVPSAPLQAQQLHARAATDFRPGFHSTPFRPPTARS